MKITDDEAHTRLVDAWNLIGEPECESVRAKTALKSARRVLMLLQLALLAASDGIDLNEPPDGPREPRG